MKIAHCDQIRDKILVKNERKYVQIIVYFYINFKIIEHYAIMASSLTSHEYKRDVVMILIVVLSAWPTGH